MVKKSLDWLLADESLGMMGAFRSRLMAERLAKKQQDGTLGKATEEPQDAELENMEIRVGDDTHYHVANEKSSSPIWPLLLATALGVGGLGTAAGMYLAQPAKKEIQQAVDLPQYNLEISVPHEKRTAP